MTSKHIYNVTQSQIDNFKPTFLYIKRHTVTGLLYFGKTTAKDPISYKGSGVYWKRHISKHGRSYVETLWCCLYLDYKELMRFALMFSEQQNIVKSDEWANMISENGISGGLIHNEYTKSKVIESNKNRTITDAYRQNASIAQLNKVRCRDKDGNVHTLTKEEFIKNKNTLSSNRKNKTVLKNRYTGEKIDINIVDVSKYDKTEWVPVLCTKIFYTPHGVVHGTGSLNRPPLLNWCLTPDEIVTRKSASSKYFHESMIGKTHKELGYWYEQL